MTGNYRAYAVAGLCGLAAGRMGNLREGFVDVREILGVWRSSSPLFGGAECVGAYN